jgi:REP element-mobilizing transposase RayT
MPDHVHILTGLHSTLSLADFVRDLKTSTNSWLKNNEHFPDFESWGEKYGAFTIFYQGKEKVIEYIKNQREHHRDESFTEEYRRLIKESGIEIDEKYFLND